jgi:flagellum-specific ATP synthase
MMRNDALPALGRSIAAIPLGRPVGRVTAIAGGAVRVAGLAAEARLGDRVRLTSEDAGLAGEVVEIGTDGLLVLPEAAPFGLRIGDPALLLGPTGVAPSDGWLGRILDPLGAPLDGRPLPPGPLARGLVTAPPPATARRRLGPRLETGLAVFNTFLPVVRGQRMGLFAGSGVGKSTLLAQLARGLAADVVVVALIGERGREVRAFAEEVLDGPARARSVIVAATSDQPAVTRRRCAWTAMTVAEHFRDRGLSVLLLADSVTRFAEAHREVALAAGETAALGGYPPSTAHQIMALAERAGPGPEATADGTAPGGGDITGIFSVLVAGADMDEPVADILRGTLDGHVVLDRAIAERGRFPAVDLLRSVSRALPRAATAEENALLQDARALLGAHERAELMIRAGLYAAGSDPLLDRAIRLAPALDAFIGSPGPKATGESFARLAAILAG